jgi:hypothetical protein
MTTDQNKSQVKRYPKFANFGEYLFCGKEMELSKLTTKWRKHREFEKSESRPFWIDLLSNVFGIETPSDGFIRFEDHRMVEASNFIDGHILSTHVLLEQKSLVKDLRKGILQSDSSIEIEKSSYQLNNV